MTKDQVIEKFKDFSEAIQEYSRGLKDGEIPEVQSIAILSVISMEDTIVSQSLISGYTDIIADSLSAVLVDDRNARDIVLAASKKSVYERIEKLSKKPEPAKS